MLRMNTQDDTTPTRPLVDVVLPVYNEEDDLPGSVNTLISYLQANAPWLWRILIADNASTDSTFTVATGMAEKKKEFEKEKKMELEEKNLHPHPHSHLQPRAC